LELSAEIEFLIKSSSISETNNWEKEILDIIPKIKYWDWIFECASRNSIAPLMFYNLQKSGTITNCPMEFSEKLNITYKTEVLRKLKIRGVFSEISQKLYLNNIMIMPLKGIILQHEIYIEPSLRPMIDIDILIREIDTEKAINLLLDMGCKETVYSESRFIDSLKHHYPPLFYKGISVELHRSLVDDYDPVQINLSNFWETSVLSEIEGIKVFKPENCHLLIYLCHHVYSSQKGGSVKLIWYCDIYFYLLKYSSSLNWDYFMQLVSEYNAEKTVYYSLGTVKFIFEYTGLPEMVYSKINEYCKKPSIIYKYLENENINFTNEHYFQKFLHIDGSVNKLKYLSNRLFPSYSFIKNKYKTNSQLKIFSGYFIEFSSFIFQGIKAMYLYFTRRD